MFRDNPLLSQLKQNMRQNTPSVEGTVKGTERGFGFLESDDGESYFIAPSNMKKIMHGDRIKAYIETNGDKTSAEPDTLVEAKLTRFIARISMTKNNRKMQIINNVNHIIFTKNQLKLNPRAEVILIPAFKIYTPNR